MDPLRFAKDDDDENSNFGISDSLMVDGGTDNTNNIDGSTSKTETAEEKMEEEDGGLGAFAGIGASTKEGEEEEESAPSSGSTNEEEKEEDTRDSGMREDVENADAKTDFFFKRNYHE